MKVGTLIIFSGLPGSGKTTLASLLATKFKATYLRIDTIEQALRDPWESERIKIDTAHLNIEESFNELIKKLPDIPSL